MISALVSLGFRLISLKGGIMQRGRSALLLVCGAFAGMATASDFDINAYSKSYDQYSATPTLVDAVAYRAILVLAGRESKNSMLESKVPMTESDIQALREHVKTKERALVDSNPALCAGVPENPTENDVVAFGKRANALIHQEDVEDAASYRLLLSELSPTAAQSIRDFVNGSVVPAFKTRRIDFERLLQDYPSAFVVTTQMICQSKPSSTGEPR
jgi:hypothetical protein